ncbi:DUF3618 domain-containing protein [Streptosporangium sp. NPDC023615]|uniref:DUF3618 domain-containing protein n=1 Tax=Streptosporangium sp. NPDC023615 TaxID=3154794 RepID=UPI003428CC77
MTETDPGGERPQAEAGTTGARRKEVGEPVTPEESGSLNIPPNQPDATPGEDPDAPVPGHGGTPRPPGTALTAVPDPDPADTTPYANTGSTVSSGAAGAAATETKIGKTVGSDGGDAESVRRDIEEARRELGDTVEALVHKTDVKGRLQETAGQKVEDLRKAGAATATTATEMVERVKAAAPEMVGRVREAAPEVVGRVKEVTPVDIKDAAGKVTTEAGKRPVATAAVLAALALIFFKVLRRGKRK